MSKPNSLRHLDDAIRRASGGTMEAYVRSRTLVANAVVVQMLPDGVVKGGSALKMRYGNEVTRFTTDLDTATAMDLSLYAERLEASLSAGWEGFSGRMVPRDPASPEGVPTEYVMQPFDVKLSYLGKPWCTVPLEVGHNEIGDANYADWVELSDAAELLKRLGFSAPGKAPLMPLAHQIAQKLHGLTSSGDRARDLVDLQLIMKHSELDLREVRMVCERLFAYRKKQAWPPVVSAQAGWDDLYAMQAFGLDVLPDVASAAQWANELIKSIVEA